MRQSFASMKLRIGGPNTDGSGAVCCQHATPFKSPLDKGDLRGAVFRNGGTCMYRRYCLYIQLALLSLGELQLTKLLRDSRAMLDLLVKLRRALISRRSSHLTYEGVGRGPGRYFRLHRQGSEYFVPGTAWQ